MKGTSLFAGSDGESHFREIEFPAEARGSFVRHHLAKGMRVGEVFIRADGNVDERRWHVASHRHFLVVLKGEIEVEVADGSKRQFGPGEVLLVEDTTGHGHRTRKIELTALIIILE